ncbi:MAG: Ni/Fe-hydrogenase, b-type cytochrome subunit [Aquificota bacterium]|nr:Ni/Fe-hydrogenase, b-type cytochrome subunit [Aquificota bacterium]
MRVYVFSPGLRVWHWVNFAAVIVLFITGLYIGDPFFSGPYGIEATYAYGEGITMGLIRKVHFIAGYVLLAGFLFRVIIAVFSRRDRMVVPKFWKRYYWESLREVTLKYLLLKRDSEGREYIRNACARTAYPLIYIALLFMIITGFSMYGLSNPDGFWNSLLGWVVVLLGGEFNVHLWHHWIAWLIIVVAVLHVYFVIREDIIKKNGELSSMINGYKRFTEKPVDMEDLR